MNSPSKDTEEPSSSSAPADESLGADGAEGSAEVRPPAKRRLSSTVIEISDTESDDSDVCAVNSYQASADEVKRIRGADYSSSSSSSDYSSDSESPWEDDSILIEDLIMDIKALKTQLNPRANRMDDPQFNPSLKSQDVIDKLTTHWKEQKDLTADNITLTCEPFRLCQVHKFLGNPEMINNIVDDMNTLDWSRKKMDLYEFHQTADLASLTWQRSIRGIYELLKTEVMSWVSAVTGLRLQSVSASCSLYGPGDHLLAHDDLLADRRVAFILYLAPWLQPRADSGPTLNGDSRHPENAGGWRGWSRRMGGALQLLGCDGAGRPCAVSRDLCPQNNMLAFFKVGPDSFHQVEEVLSLELPRLSINGWFHGPADTEQSDTALADNVQSDSVQADSVQSDNVQSDTAQPDSVQSEVPPADSPQAVGDKEPPESAAVPLRPHNEIVLLNQWIEATYMSPRSRMQIQAQMERESEVSLRNFFLPDKCAQLLEELASPEVQWAAAGPLDRRRYELAGRPAEGSAVHALLELMSSGAFVRMLAECTDLALVSYERLELQRWAAGDYTLLPPQSAYSSPRLEAVLYLRAGSLGPGGGRVFVAPEDAAEERALVTLPPQHNALALVYCDAGCASFTKYVSRLALRPRDRFYVLQCSYRE